MVFDRQLSIEVRSAQAPDASSAFHKQPLADAPLRIAFSMCLGNRENPSPAQG
jgi:hypothetical protein